MASEVVRPRAQYAYRLLVAYPEGSRYPDEGWQTWTPDGWEPDPWGPIDDDQRFRWPAERTCLSMQTAVRRARLFEKYGAKVVIERSERIVWPSQHGDTEGR